MITFKPTIRKEKQRKDKTWHVFIQVVYGRKRKFLPTAMYATKSDLTTSYKIKNQTILDRCAKIIASYREKLPMLDLEISPMSIDEVCSFLTKVEERKDLSFSAFFSKWSKEAKIKGIGNYKTAVNAFEQFVGRKTILFSDINVAAMKQFELSLYDRPRAQSLYTTAIKHLFEEARLIYNDEENDIILIKNSLARYAPPRQNVAKKRALTLEQVRKIFSLPYNNKVIKGFSSRHDLALDCFKLSFCLLGMNSADLFNAAHRKGDTIVYERTKTRDRRNDNAEIHVDIHPYIRPLVEKYCDKNRVFNFHRRFSSLQDLNKAINVGLKEVGKEIGVEDLQFYSARHSLASIAANEVKIDRWTVNLMLNHTDTSMRVTELYIKRDFEPINTANAKVIEYVFKETPHS